MDDTVAPGATSNPEPGVAQVSVMLELMVKSLLTAIIPLIATTSPA